MDAVKFLKERNRMCKMYDGCYGCNLNTAEPDCVTYEIENPEKAVEIVEKWSKENPYSYYDEFCKRFPKRLYVTFVHFAENSCVNSLFGTDYDCRKSCEECWNQEYKGE